MIFTVLQLISVWKKVPLNSLLYYLPITAGYSITIVSIKIFITVSMMIGNIIDIYLLGIMMISLNYVMYSGYFGLIIISYLLYLFLTKMEVFLIISFMLESFSLLFQSITLSNRLSINIPAGSLLIPSLSVAVIIFTYDWIFIVYWIGWLYYIIYCFEILNMIVQLFIFTLLCIEYIISSDLLVIFL